MTETGPRHRAASLMPGPASTTADVVVRRATPDDLPSILALASDALSWFGDDEDAAFFRWKHLENPFGASPMWVACDGARIAGFRTFLRWSFRTPDGSTVHAARAVDTATDPSYQGRGIFTRLTLGALDELREEGVELIFNTPNQRSLPGYLKMGWKIVGRLPVAVRLTRPGSLVALARARQPAGHNSIEIRVGERASDVFADEPSVARLLSAQPPARGLATDRSPELLAWRYGYAPLHYRALFVGSAAEDGLIVFHLRRRGGAVEGVVCDVLTPETDRSAERRLLREVAERTGADYLIRLQRSTLARGPFVRVPRTGPILTCRPLDDRAAPRLREWDLTMGDIALF